MVLGEDAFLNNQSRLDFQRSGTYHILVVSGMNVGILAFVVFWLMVLRAQRAANLGSGCFFSGNAIAARPIILAGLFTTL